jgi:hypothetical protein
MAGVVKRDVTETEKLFGERCAAGIKARRPLVFKGSGFSEWLSILCSLLS